MHLVLARLPDAPPGIKGISLFVIPKLREEGGKLLPNGVTCGAIEHKMGIKASPTCVINFDNAEGFLVGEPNKGMKGMFTFMNGARLHVGVQGLALAEASYQAAVKFARERLQGRALTGTKYPNQEADPILVHPDVRRMLLTMRAFTEGARALTAWAAIEIDHAENDPDPARAQIGDDLASLLTPVIKAFQTDLGFEMTNHGVQVCGGYGYCVDYGVEQLVRDCRITQIYEGTNGIQALDLVGRKLPAHLGRYLRRFFHPVQEFLTAEADNAEMKEFVEPTAKAFERLQRATAWLAQESMKNPDEAGAGATDYLHLFGYTALAYLWARMAKIALAEARREDRRGVLRDQARHGAVLHAAHPAPQRWALRDRHGRQQDADGVPRRRVLRAAGPRAGRGDTAAARASRGPAALQPLWSLHVRPRRMAVSGTRDPGAPSEAGRQPRSRAQSLPLASLYRRGLVDRCGCS